MLCDSCYQRPATCHVTSIVGDAMQKRDLCEECFEAMSPGMGPALSPKPKCQYCGGERFCVGTDVLAIMLGTRETKALCIACNAEYHRFTQRALVSLPDGLSQERQLAEIRKLREEADAHMEQWVSERGSV
jgi:protein-arginine kinase activator protein McsA